MENIDLNVWMLVAVFIVTFFTKTYGVIIGGASFILQPFLLAIGVPPQMAIAHDIAGTNGSTISGLYVFRKSGSIRFKLSSYMLPGLVVGPFAGVWLLSVVPASYIENFIAVVSCLGAGYLLIRRKSKEGLEEAPLPQNWSLYAVIYGFFIGAYIGFSGAGGGIVTGLVLVSFFGLTMTQSIATKRIIHALPFITSAFGYLAMGWLQWDLFLTVFSACLCAGWVGSHITLRLNEKVLKVIFLSAAILMALIILF